MKAKRTYTPEQKAKRQKLLFSIFMVLAGMGFGGPKLLEAFKVFAPEEVEAYLHPTTPPGTGTGTGPVVVQPSQEGLDRFEEFIALREVHVDGSMSQKEIDDMIGDPNGTRVIVHGTIPQVYIGGSNNYAITGLDQTPVHDLEFVGADDTATIKSVKFGGDRGGIDGEVRFRNITVQPALDGDFSPFRTIGSMYDMHLIMQDVSLTVPEGWTGFMFGMKWGARLQGPRLTVLGLESDPAREHTFYLSNCSDVWLENVRNRTRMYTDVAGVIRELGNGRTLIQHANRVPDTYPKGGNPSTGSIVYKNCVATLCGWEGITAWTDKEGNIHAGGKPGGGSAFTLHGHTGDRFLMLNCTAQDTLSGGIAVWSEPGYGKATESNPLGIRSWMISESGETYNPFLAASVDGWTARQVDIVNYVQEAAGSRTAILVSGTRRLTIEGAMVEGVPATVESGHIKLNHQAGVRAIEFSEILQ